MDLINKCIKRLEKRCMKCPANYSVKMYDDIDAGCNLENEDKSFCIYWVVPRWVVKFKIHLLKKREERYWDKYNKFQEKECVNCDGDCFRCSKLKDLI